MTDHAPIETIRDGLRSDDAETRRQTLRALYREGAKIDEFEAYEPFVDDIAVMLEDDDPSIREGVIHTLHHIGALEAEHVSTYNRTLEAEDSTIGLRVVDVFYAIAEDSPELLAPIVPSLIAFLSTRHRMADESENEAVSEGENTVEDAGAEREPDVVEHDSREELQFHLERQYKSIVVLSQVAEDDATVLVPVIDDLVAIGKQDIRLRNTVLEILTAVADEHPEECASAIDPARAIMVAMNDPKLRTNAAYLLAMIAEEHLSAVAEAVDPHLEVLFDMLDSEHPQEQNAAIGLLSYVAEDRPEAVSPATDTLVDLLEHPLESIRGNAIWTLEYIGDEAAAARIETVAHEDSSEAVRRLATDTSASLASE